MRTPATCDTSGARRLEGPARVLRCMHAPGARGSLFSSLLSVPIASLSGVRTRESCVGGRGVTLRGSLKYHSSSRGSGALRRAALAARRYARTLDYPGRKVKPARSRCRWCARWRRPHRLCELVGSHVLHVAFSPAAALLQLVVVSLPATCFVCCKSGAICCSIHTHQCWPAD